MGRSSTSGMVYLVKRPEGGFSYVRNLSNGLAETLSGELDLSWSADRRKVGGGKILKIALATSDLNLARQRWLEIHPQVEHLIGFAKDTFQRKRKRPPRRHAAAGASSRSDPANRGRCVSADTGLR